MLGLRERVIAAICEGWPNPDNEVNKTQPPRALLRPFPGPLRGIHPLYFAK
jgi:hypothetical protein